MSDFNIDEFLDGLENDVPVSGGDRINKLLMNTRDNQGSIEILPFMSKKFGAFYHKVADVREFRCPTSLLDTENEIWHKILSLQDYEDLSDEDLALYNEVTGLYDTLGEMEVLDYDTLRWRNYTLMYGYVLNHTNTEDDKVEDSIGSPALLIFPSHSVIEALSTSIKAKINSAKGNKSWLPSVLSPSNKGRKGSLVINFKKPNSPGYSTSVSIELNSEFNVVIDPEREFGDEVTKFFDDPIRDLLGWQGGEGNNHFNRELFKDLRDRLKLEIKAHQAEEKEVEKPENKNAGTDPMKGKSNKAPF